MRTRHRPLAAAVLPVILLAAGLTGCGDKQTVPTPTSATLGAAGPLKGVSVAVVLAAIDAAHLPALNPHDVTASVCPAAGCTEARATDTVSILKFPSTGRAEIYAAAIRDMVQVEDVVLVFDSAVGDSQKQAYSQAVKRAVAHG